MTGDPYIELRNGNSYVRGSRVSLRSIAADWNDGLSAEEIREDFPTLRLAEAHRAIAYYLDHRAEMDTHFKELPSTKRAEPPPRLLIQSVMPGRASAWPKLASAWKQKRPLRHQHHEQTRSFSG